MAEVTVAASLVADMVGYLRARGIDADAVCRRAGVTAEMLTGAGARIPGRAMSAFWKHAIEATGDEHLGLHTTVESNPGTLDIVGYVMLSSRTADDALRRGARLIRVLNDGVAIELTREGARTHARVILLAPGDAYLREQRRQIVETILIGIVHQLRLLTRRPVTPLAIAMEHATPASGAAEHARLFGVAPRFLADRDQVTIANTDLDLALPSANPQLLESFEALANAALASLSAADTLRGRVSAVIVDRLKGEAPSIGVVARALAMSARHLQRGLAAEGTTYQSLLDEARRELAVRHLASPDATVAKVAWLVGFAEPSAFHRAFRRWTGQSPRAVA
jgi:AraC-like DNA-binding protein